MIKYFPFPATFDLKMGTSPLKGGCCIEPDEHYRSEIALKRHQLTADHSYYYRAAPDTQPAQWEVAEKILTELAKTDPQNFRLQCSEDRWTWENRLLNESQTFVFGDSATLPLEPLDWVGRQVQEDLLLIGADATLVAGQLCFPSGWSLDDKFGKLFLEIHAPLPGFMSPMMQSANTLLERLPAHAPIQRNNWGFRVCDQLDLSSRHNQYYQDLLREVSSGLTIETVGDKVFLRVEHQTLSRLPVSGCALFTIHTYNNSLAEIARHQNEANLMLSFLRTVPPALIDFKLMTLFAPTLLLYLSSVTSSEAH